MFSQAIEYALRVVVFHAADPPTPYPSGRIAECTRVPRGYLLKVLQHLGKAGLLHSQRGLHGGFKLTCSPGAIPVLEIVNAVNPIQRINECPLGLDVHSDELCPLHRRLAAALASIEQAFGSTTIAEVLAEPSKSKPLCGVAVEDDAV